jgi:hypothetical protein
MHSRSTVRGMALAKVRSTVSPVAAYHRNWPVTVTNPPGDEEVGTDMEYQTASIDAREGIGIIYGLQAQGAKIILIKLGICWVLDNTR